MFLFLLIIFLSMVSKGSQEIYPCGEIYNPPDSTTPSSIIRPFISGGKLVENDYEYPWMAEIMVYEPDGVYSRKTINNFKKTFYLENINFFIDFFWLSKLLLRRCCFYCWS